MSEEVGNILIIVMFPTVHIKDIQHFYSQPVQARYQDLIAKFTHLYGEAPELIARAPGRVNIIGEHIDYEGYGVLPAAIEKDCLIAIKKTQTETIQINHVLGEKFPSCKLSKFPQQISENIPHSYAKYFAAGYRAGILDLAEPADISGLKILIQGNIPWAAGVSSSSAFCVCSALVSYSSTVKKKSLPSEQFVERCIKFEREVGTASGGMDQSISILGKINSCLHIQFNPIRGEKVAIPSENYKFIIMNSLVESAKMETAVYRYNKRVCECRMALWLLSKAMGIKKQVYSEWKILKQLQEWMKLQLYQMPLIVTSFLKNVQYTKEMIREELQCEDLMEVIGDIVRAKDVLEANEYFAIYQAAVHVFSEAQRVRDFISVCESSVDNDAKAKVLGNLMNLSQDSCRDLYHCSCDELDELTRLAVENGAVGSRLTGAGWGGCTVSLVRSEEVGEFMRKMEESYYSKDLIKPKVDEYGLKNVMFATLPCQGAFVVSV